LSQRLPLGPFSQRLWILESVLFFALLGVEARLAYLQVIKHHEYSQLASHQQYTSKETQPVRGLIEDRNGTLLATNIDLYNVCGHPDQIPDKCRTAAVLSGALGIPYGTILSKLSEEKSFVWLARQVPFERSQAVESLKLEGIEASREERRFYPDRDMAAQVLGFTGMDNQGLNGLERYYEKFLAGQKGQVKEERDARGRQVISDNEMKKQSVDGANLITTLDTTLQHVAQVELQKAFDKYRCKAASIAVMNPKTGEILAMANFPTFDPNHFSTYPPEIWRNRMVNDEFEPGSTFKLVTALGALEEGVVNEDDKFFCENGAYHTDYGRVVTDHEKHGWLTFREVFGYSSNIGMVKVGAKLGKDNLYRYCQRLGFGVTTGIDLPGEASGKLRPEAQWSGISMTTIPYGYEVSATPIQVLQAYAAIANGGVMMKPYIVQSLVGKSGTVLKSFAPVKERRICSEKTAKRMTDLMRWVVEKGTGTAVDLPAYPIAGKTGTAYKFMNGHYSRYNYVSSFVGFVPADNPKFVIYCSLDDPRGLYWGGYTAGPVFKEVAKRSLSYALVPSEKPDLEVASVKRDLPSFLGLSRPQALQLAKDRQVKYKFLGKGKRVITQAPIAGNYDLSDGENALAVTLTLGKFTASAASTATSPSDSPAPPDTMPDLRGKTKRQALALLAPLGLKVSFTGEGIVRSQFPPVGRSLKTIESCDLSCDLPAVRADLPQGGHS
jgi:cell division protein FtsI/penicillin-binding protein 2